MTSNVLLIMKEIITCQDSVYTQLSKTGFPDTFTGPSIHDNVRTSKRESLMSENQT